MKPYSTHHGCTAPARDAALSLRWPALFVGAFVAGYYLVVLVS